MSVMSVVIIIIMEQNKASKGHIGVEWRSGNVR